MSTSIRPLISVVIPAYNEEKFLDKCLVSLMKQDLDKKYFEVIIVDNASTDKTSEVAQKYPFKLIYEPKRSVVIARQAGAEKSLGEIIVSADADTVYPPDWLSRIKYDFDKNPGIVGVVGWIYFTGASTSMNIFVDSNQQINLFVSKYSKKFPLCFAANMAFKKTALNKLGGYPTHLPELGDQQYILFRLQKLGRVIVDKRVYCFTSNRRHKKILKNMLDNSWHRFIGYPVNRLAKKQVIGPAPAIRTVRVGKRGKNKFLARLKRIS